MAGSDGGFQDVSRHDLQNAAASIYGCARTLRDSSERLRAETREELLNVIIAQSEWLGRAIEPQKVWAS